MAATLRGHGVGVTVMEFVNVEYEAYQMLSPEHLQTTETVEVETQITTQSTAEIAEIEEKAPLIPLLISADESGFINLWSLSSRRSIHSWKAHDNNILSIIQIPHTHFLVTHSRDHTLKIWNLRGYRQMFSHKINATNFCNVAVQDTTFSSVSQLRAENFDIFTVKLNQNCESWNYTARFENIDPVILVEKWTKEVAEEKEESTGNKEEPPKKLGIIMKLQWVGPCKLAIGCESGHVVIIQVPSSGSSLLSLDDTKMKQLEEAMDSDNVQKTLTEMAGGNINQLSHLMYGDTTENAINQGMKVISVVSVNVPSPVIDIVVDLRGIMYCTCTGAEIAVICELNEVHKANLKSIGASIDVRSDGVICTAFWNGQVKFYRWQNGRLCKVGTTITKQKAHIAKEFTANPNDPDLLNKQIKRFKSNCVRVSIAQPKVLLGGRNVKELLRNRKLEKVRETEWIAIGYDDGSIELREGAGRL